LADRPTRPEAEPSGMEIEITPAMIEAGRETLYTFDIMHPVESEMSDAVRAVFLSMLRLQSQKYHVQSS
jgi:hypothetical protein